jgi:hypothetical protein
LPEIKKNQLLIRINRVWAWARAQARKNQFFILIVLH